MVSKTSFYDKHLSLNAKMIDFGGWDMPVHYGSQINEHLQTRKSVSLFDVSHMAVVDITGSDADAFLLKLLANNINKLEHPGQALYSCMLNPQGGIIDDLIVYKMPGFYRLVINASTAISDLAWMRANANNFHSLKIIPRRFDIPESHSPLVLLALQGPQSISILTSLFPNIGHEIVDIPYFGFKILNTVFGEIMLSRTGYTGEDGFELFIPYDQGIIFWDLFVNHGVFPAGLGARDTLRIEAGYNLYGQDMNESITPFDCGLSWTVDMQNDRNFIGSSALISHPKKFSFLGLILLTKGVLRSHQVVKTHLGNGEITSGTYSPSLQKSIAFARLPAEIKPSMEVQVLIRDQLYPARVVKPVFVRRGQVFY